MRIALLLGLVCGWSSTQLLATERPQKPNIIHIIADDVGYDDLSCYGAQKIKTPNLDRLAKQGMRFTSFYAPHATCTPTRAALLTGREPARMPAIDHVLSPSSNTGLSPQAEVSLGTLLQQQGYHTAVIGKWHLGHRPEFSPLKNGFDLFLGIPYPNDHDPIRPNFRNAPPIPLYRGTEIIEQPAKLATLPDRFLAEAQQFITANKTTPFYLHYANIETHTPWFVPERFEGKSADGPFGDAVECLDWQVGELLKTLDEQGLAKNTLIFFSADNGPLVHRYPDLETAYGKFSLVDPKRPHVLREGKYQSRFEGGPRVAAIAYWPGYIPAGVTNDDLVAGYDLFTTFVKLAGATVPTDRVIDGQDLWPILTAEPQAAPLRTSFFAFRTSKLAGVRSKQWKLAVGGGKVKPALYDLSRDLGEQTDLAAEQPEVLQQLQTLAGQARDSIRDGKPLPK